MATAAMAGQQMEMMGSRVRARSSRAESLAERNRELFETQRRARRGPTPEVFFTKHIDNSRIVKADDPERRREMRHVYGGDERSVSAGDGVCVAALFGDRDWLPR